MTKIKNKVVWFTGMSGSGKSTLATKLSESLTSNGHTVKIIDGDQIRKRLNFKNDFSPESIKFNNRKIIDICHNLLKQFNFILVAVIMPFESIRNEARSKLGESYYEIFVKSDLKTLISRDTKGLYQKALNGEIKNFIGIDIKTPFENPKKPNLIIESDLLSVSESCKLINSKILN